MTGGLDSRLVLASYLNEEVYPSLTYGVGNSKLTNTLPADLRINKLFEEKLSLKFHQMDWRTSPPIDNSWVEEVNKYGFLSRIYSASDGIFTSLENLDAEFIDFGYFGEPLRNVNWLEGLRDDYFTIDDFLDDFYINKNLQKFLDKSYFNKYRSHLLKKLINICKLFELEPNSIHKNQFQILHNEYRKGADTAMLNFVNYHRYSISLLSLHEIECFVKAIDSKSKNKSQLIIKLLNILSPQVLDIPIFSYCEIYTLDKTRTYLQRKDKHLSVYRKTIYLMDSFSPSRLLLNHSRNLKYKIFERINSTKADGYLRKYLLKKLNNENNQITLNKKVFSGDTRYLAEYVQTLYILDCLNCNPPKKQSNCK